MKTYESERLGKVTIPENESMTHTCPKCGYTHTENEGYSEYFEDGETRFWCENCNHAWWVSDE